MEVGLNRTGMGKKVLIGIAIILAIALIACFTVGEESLSPYIEQRLVGAAKKHNITLSIKETKVSYVHLDLRNIDLALVRRFFPLMFKLDFLNVKMSPGCLIGGSVCLTLDGQSYAGRIRSEIGYNMFSSSATGWANIDHLQLKLHPQIAGLGVQDGSLTARIEKFRFSAPNITGGEIQLMLSNVNRPGKLVIPIMSPLQIVIPRGISRLSLSADCTFEKSGVICKSIESNSSLGRVSARGRALANPDGSLNNIDLEANAYLSPDGLETFGSYLPLISGGQLAATDSSFNMKLSGLSSAPKVRFSRIN
jgi:hypothetical protein